MTASTVTTGLIPQTDDAGPLRLGVPGPEMAHTMRRSSQCADKEEHER
jgi:hypothetical protein